MNDTNTCWRCDCGPVYKGGMCEQCYDVAGDGVLTLVFAVFCGAVWYAEWRVLLPADMQKFAFSDYVAYGLLSAITTLLTLGILALALLGMAAVIENAAKFSKSGWLNIFSYIMKRRNTAPQVEVKHLSGGELDQILTEQHEEKMGWK